MYKNMGIKTESKDPQPLHMTCGHHSGSLVSAGREGCEYLSGENDYDYTSFLEFIKTVTTVFFRT